MVCNFDCDETEEERGREWERGTNCEYEFVKSESCLAENCYVVLFREFI